MGDVPADQDPAKTAAQEMYGEPERWPWEVTDAGADAPPRPEATMLQRLDGHGLIYPGLLHTVIGEPESGKSWVGIALTVESARSGRSAVFIDYEDNYATFRQRLDVLGITEWDRKSIVYTSVEREWRAAPEVILEEYPDTASVVLDGTSEAMSLMGYEPTGTEDAVKWLAWCRRWTHTGAAVLTVDHVVKDKMQQGRWALGSQHKMAGVHVTYVAEPQGLLRPGREAAVNLTIAKDRPGDVRQHGGEGIGRDRLQRAGALVFGGDLTGGGWHVSAPLTHVPGAPPPDNPKMSKAKEMIRVYLIVARPLEATTRNAIRDALVGGPVGRDMLLAALVQLVQSGEVIQTYGPNNATFHALAGQVDG